MSFGVSVVTSLPQQSSIKMWESCLASMIFELSNELEIRGQDVHQIDASILLRPIIPCIEDHRHTKTVGAVLFGTPSLRYITASSDGEGQRYFHFARLECLIPVVPLTAGCYPNIAMC